MTGSEKYLSEFIPKRKKNSVIIKRNLLVIHGQQKPENGLIGK
jgi:hypothetical protein